MFKAPVPPRQRTHNQVVSDPVTRAKYLFEHRAQLIKRLIKRRNDESFNKTMQEAEKVALKHFDAAYVFINKPNRILQNFSDEALLDIIDMHKNLILNDPVLVETLIHEIGQRAEENRIESKHGRNMFLTQKKLLDTRKVQKQHPERYRPRKFRNFSNERLVSHIHKYKEQLKEDPATTEKLFNKIAKRFHKAEIKAEDKPKIVEALEILNEIKKAQLQSQTQRVDSSLVGNPSGFYQSPPSPGSSSSGNNTDSGHPGPSGPSNPSHFHGL